VRAPFNATVFRIDTTQGALLTRADHPITLADLAVLEATVYAPAANFSDLVTGRSYPVRVLAPLNRTTTARLRFVDMLMDAASGRFRCVFTLDNPDGTIPAGAEVEVTLNAVTATR
jgi:multidrug efflux pump subunit AcrA (membrane-fusion protein)